MTEEIEGDCLKSGMANDFYGKQAAIELCASSDPSDGDSAC